MDALPFESKPHDAMRMGLAALKEDAVVRHPVEEIQKEHRDQALARNNKMMRDVYGIAMPAKLEIEKQILSKFGRLPGIPSSHLGYEAMTGELDNFGFESYLGLPDTNPVPMPDLHSQMECRLGLGSEKIGRGII